MDIYGTPVVNRPDYQALKAETPRLIDAIMEKMFGMLGLRPSPGVNITINYKIIDGLDHWDGDSFVSNTLPLSGNISLDVDIADFLDLDDDGEEAYTQLPSLNIYDDTRETGLFWGIFDEFIFEMGGPHYDEFENGFGSAMMSLFASQYVPTLINSDGGLIRLLIIFGFLVSSSNEPVWQADEGLAGIYISQRYGTDKLIEINDLLLSNPPMGYKAAIESVLKIGSGGDFANWAEFEAATDAFALEYLNNFDSAGYERNGLGWTDMQNYLGPAAELILQTGIHAEDTLQTFLPWATAGSLDYLAFVDVSTEENARRSLFTIRERALPLVNMARGRIGAMQNRLEKEVSNAQSHMLNLSNSQSFIRDTDFANETAAMVKNQILTQSSAAMCAQANLQTQIILQLLGSIS